MRGRHVLDDREAESKAPVLARRRSVGLAEAFEHVRQVEIIFSCRMRAAALEGLEKGFEIDRAEWFARDALPRGLSADQRRVIERALAVNARE